MKKLFVLLTLIAGTETTAQAQVKNPATCIGLNGEVCLAWFGDQNLQFMRSTDGGKTWPAAGKTINPAKNADHYKAGSLTVNGVPVIACDTGRSSFRGRIYISWSDEKYGEKNKDVFLVYSDDRGETWTEPILVTYRPNHKEQFKPQIAIEPATGKLSILYFDRQNYIAGPLADVYLAVSRNGGLKFDYYRMNQQPVKLEQGNSLNNLLLWDGKAFRLAWTNLDNRKKEVTLAALANDSLLATYNMGNMAGDLQMERSIAFAPKIKVEFKTLMSTTFSAVITKPLEPTFEKAAVTNMKCQAGSNTLWLDTKQLGLAKGNYILTLYCNGKNQFVWITAD